MADHFPIIVGEWSLYTASKEALTYGKKEKEVYYRTLADAQLRAWENAVGWFFWSYKLHIISTIPKLMVGTWARK
jgi:hypothetical protein